MGFQELAQYGATGIALALIGMIIYIVKIMLPVMSKSAEKFSNSLDANTKVTLEMHEFLRSLNGRLKKVVDDKLKDK